MMDNLTRVFTNNWVKIGPNVLQNKKSFFFFEDQKFWLKQQKNKL